MVSKDEIFSNIFDTQLVKSTDAEPEDAEA
jgi:hypothetical protein